MTPAAFVIALHVIAAVFWVGGMAFAYGALRPAAERSLDSRARRELWLAVLARFFPGVWVSVVVLLASGYYLVFGVYGGFSAAGGHVHAMHALGLVMVALFAHVYFAPWRRFRRAVWADDGSRAATELPRIRRVVAVNLVLGIVVVAVAAGGRFWR